MGVPGSVYRFAWAPIPSLQYSGVPFRVSIAAQDFQNNLATSFSGTATLGLYLGAADQHPGRRFFLRFLFRQLDGWLLIHSGPGHSGDGRAILFWHESFHLAERWHPGRQPAGDQRKRDLGANTPV